jgi:peptidoglycan/xylan/chitin deacetylase (PgdA/CDA1 family)
MTRSSLLTPPSPAARRAARRAQLRRRRIVAATMTVLLLTATSVVVVVSGSPVGRARPAKPGSARGSDRFLIQPRRRSATEAAGDARIRRLAGFGLPVFCGGSRGNELAFTFDDGPGPYTHFALKKLAAAGERATFFVIGRSVGSFPGYLPRELRVGTIADHTATHPVLTRLSPDEIVAQIETTAHTITRATGQPVELFRPPYGARNATVDRIARRLGLLEVVWSVDSADSLGADYAGIIRNVEAGMRPGAIILMHENRGQTIRALTTLLPVLHHRHLRSVTLPELFATDPPTVPQVRRGRSGCARPDRPAAHAGG